MTNLLNKVIRSLELQWETDGHYKAAKDKREFIKNRINQLSNFQMLIIISQSEFEGDK